jgi:hypothetical protein
MEEEHISVIESLGWEIRTGHNTSSFIPGKKCEKYTYIICDKLAQKIEGIYESYRGDVRVTFYVNEKNSKTIEETYFGEYGIYGWGETEDEAIKCTLSKRI